MASYTGYTTCPALLAPALTAGEHFSSQYISNDEAININMSSLSPVHLYKLDVKSAGQETALLNIILSCCHMLQGQYCQDMLGRLQYWCGAYYCYAFRECNTYFVSLLELHHECMSVTSTSRHILLYSNCYACSYHDMFTSGISCELF